MKAIVTGDRSASKTRPSIPLRAWATPLTIGAFVLMAATGILMFFGWRGGLISEVHEWFSWLFLAGAVAHLVVNYRPLTLHLKSRWGRTILAASAVVLVVAVLPSGVRTNHQLPGLVERALVAAPLSTVANLANVAPADLESRLRAHSVVAAMQQSVREVSEQNHLSEHGLLAIVFMKD
jgi:hypothetical protein